MLKPNFSRSRGSTIAETAASLVLMLPLIMLMLFVVVEASTAYLIKEALSQASRQGARDLAVAWGQNPNIENNRSYQDQIFENIRLKGVVNANEQFENPVWNTGGAPPTVTVTVRYTGGEYGLSPFPNPDPLGLGKDFQISATSTYRLE